MKKIAAFFDFDGTVCVEETPSLMGRYFTDRGARDFAGMPLSRAYYGRVVAASLLARARLYPEERLAALLLRFYRGRSRRKVEEWAPDFYSEYLAPRISPVMVEAMEEHRRNGHLVVMVSGGVTVMLRPACDALGVDHLLCTELETGPDGGFTGRPEGDICVGRGKTRFVERFREAQDIDMGASSAYGNHHSDIPLMEAVGNPVAVNPTPSLRREARVRRWPVVDFIK